MDPAAERAFENKIREVIDEYSDEAVEKLVKGMLKELFVRCALLQTQMLGKPPEEIQAAVSKLLMEWIEED